MQNTLAIPDRVNATVIESATGVGPYGFDFEWRTSDEIVVEIYGERISGFTVAGDNKAQGQFYVGGRVTLLEPIDGAHLIIRRASRPGRRNDISSGGATPQAINAELDRLSMVDVDTREGVDRALKFRHQQSTPDLDVDLWKNAVPYLGNQGWSHIGDQDIHGANSLFEALPLIRDLIDNLPTFLKLGILDGDFLARLGEFLSGFSQHSYFVPKPWSEIAGTVVDDERELLRWYSALYRPKPELLPYTVPVAPVLDDLVQVIPESYPLIAQTFVGLSGGETGAAPSSDDLVKTLTKALGNMRARLHHLEENTGFVSDDSMGAGPVWLNAAPTRTIRIGQPASAFWQSTDIVDADTDFVGLHVMGSNFPAGVTVDGGVAAAGTSGTYTYRRTVIDLDGNRQSQTGTLVVMRADGTISKTQYSEDGAPPSVSQVSTSLWVPTRDTVEVVQ